MKLFFRIILLILALSGISGLGYYAYILATDIIDIPFYGQEEQYGDSLILTANIPVPFAHLINQDTPIFDLSAIKKSILYNGVHYTPTSSGEVSLVFRDDYFEFTPRGDLFKNGDTFRLSARKYNNNQTTGYRLANDIVFHKDTANEKKLIITPIGEPKDKKYVVEMSGYQNFSPEDIRWYINNKNLQGECGGEEGILWNSHAYERVRAYKEERQDSEGGGQQVYTLDYNTHASHQCLIAGISNTLQLVENRTLADFTLTGVFTEMSPLHDMKTQFDVSFSEPIFLDTEEVYSSGYLQKRQEKKEQLLARLHISPEVILTPNDILLSPQKLQLLLPLQEGEKYKIYFDALSDIYGRTASLHTSIIPEKKPFLSLGLDQKQGIFSDTSPIRADIFSMNTPKNTYTIKICRTDFSAYTKMKKKAEVHTKESFDALYDFLISSEVFDCQKKDIPLDPSGKTSFFIKDLIPNTTLSPGLYILALRDKEDALFGDQSVFPRFFSVLDTHITLKTDVSGKMYVLATDMRTGKPKENQLIHLFPSDGSFDFNNQEKDAALPPEKYTYASGALVLGKTDTRGIVQIGGEHSIAKMLGAAMEKNSQEVSPENVVAFSLTASTPTSFGYVESTWTQQSAGWNFGKYFYKKSEDIPLIYIASLYTDIPTYRPRDTVFLYGTIRQRNTSLLPPGVNSEFLLHIIDSKGAQIQKIPVSSNEFGTFSYEWILPQDIEKGTYRMKLTLKNEENIQKSYGDGAFEVQGKEAPYIQAGVVLKSTNVERGIIGDIRKKLNTQKQFPWYEYVYSAPLILEGIIHAQYTSGEPVKNMPFQYRLIRTPLPEKKGEESCSFGCYSESASLVIAEGKSQISDMMGYVRIPLEFNSFAEAYEYRLEVLFSDPITHDEIHSQGTLSVALPKQYTSFLSEAPVEMEIPQRFIQQGTLIRAILPQKMRNIWKESIQGQYAYSLSREYSLHKTIQGLGIQKEKITTQTEELLLSGVISTPSLTLPTEKLPSGKYHFRTFPRVSDRTLLPAESIVDTVLYITSSTGHTDDTVHIIPDKAAYDVGEKAQIFFVSPFSGGTLFLTRERGGIIDSEYISVQNHITMTEYTIDNTFLPYTYIGATAFPGESNSGASPYALGYGELLIHTDTKQANIQISSDRTHYRSGDLVHVDLQMTNAYNNTPQAGEVMVAVIDKQASGEFERQYFENFSRLYTKAPSTLTTALTSIGKEPHRFLGMNTGKQSIFSQMPSENTHTSYVSSLRPTQYFTGALQTNAQGQASLSFVLPSESGQYSIIALGNTKDSTFGYAKKDIEVTKDYRIDIDFPSSVFVGDSFLLQGKIVNNTEKITPAKILLEVGTGVDMFSQEKEVILNVHHAHAVQFSLIIPDTWKGTIPYSLTLKKGNTILEKQEKTFSVAPLPFGAWDRTGEFFSGQKIFPLEKMPEGSDRQKSEVLVRISQNFAFALAPIIENIQKNTTLSSSARAARIFINGWKLSIQGKNNTVEEERASLQEQIQSDIQALNALQYTGGWRERMSDVLPNDRISPFILSSLIESRPLGVTIPDVLIEKGTEFLIQSLKEHPNDTPGDRQYRAEVFALLARQKHPFAQTLQKDIDVETLSRHGLICYIRGLQYLNKELTDTFWKKLEVLFSLRDDQINGYWTRQADEALYAQILLSAGKTEQAKKVLAQLLQTFDPHESAHSIEENIALFQALSTYEIKNPTQKSTLSFQADAIKGESILSDQNPVLRFQYPRALLGENITLTTSGSAPVFVEIIEKNILNDIIQMSPKQVGGIELSRRIEWVDETKGITSNGEFLVTVPLEENAGLKQNNLYRSVYTLHFSDINEAKGQNILLEIFSAAGWNVLLPELSHISPGMDDIGERQWMHRQVFPEKISLEHRGVSENDTISFVYYFRPTLRGELLLPPARASFVHNPQIHTYTQYSRLRVE